MHYSTVYVGMDVHKETFSLCCYTNEKEQAEYRTMSEWERDGRHAPDYLIRLLDYYVRMEGLIKENKDTLNPSNSTGLETD